MGKEENAIQSAIMEYLTIRNILNWRNNNIPVPGRRFIGRKGSSDIFALHKGKFMGIEVKTSTGTQSDDQKDFEKDVIDNGGIYILARCVEDVEEMLNEVML